MRVVQLLPTLAFGDAIGNDTLALKKLLKKRGFDTAIYAENIDQRLPDGTAESYDSFPALADDDVILYHASTGTQLNIDLPKLGGKKVMIYHNITPPEFFAPYSRDVEKTCKEGYEQIRFLSDKVDYCIADSEFNRSELRSMGYTCPIDVCPILIPFEDYEKAPDKKILQKYGNSQTVTWLFTGRVAPNKKHEDIIRAFYYYHNFINTDSRLIFVGSWISTGHYYSRLSTYVEMLSLQDSIIFTGQVKFEEILAYYRIADVFVCMSEHEGFCVPLVEAMYFGKPVAAFDSCVIPETLGGGGMLLSDKDPKHAAVMINRLLSNPLVLEKTLLAQKERLKYFQYENVEDRFISLLTTFMQNSSMPRVVQMVTGIHYGDAVGNDVVAIKRVLVENGYRTEIYTGFIDPRFPTGTGKLYQEMPEFKPDDVVIYHFAAACLLSEQVKLLPCRVILRYHNITPPHFFHGLNKANEHSTQLGLQQIMDLKPYVDYCLTDSAFNGENLQEMGYSCPMDVLPIMIPFKDYEKHPDQSVIDAYSDGKTNLLFVGRMAPNKKVEDVISAFSAYKKKYDPEARLFLVGSYQEDEYYHKLQKHIERLRVDDVFFPGHIPFTSILAYYAIADVFLCMSEHEGFCVPLVEAMFFHVPILAYDCCAIPGTLGGSGVLVEKKDYDAIASQISRMIKDKVFRAEIIKKQDERLKDFSYERVSGQLIDYLHKFMQET